jgi:hypothetical protein
MMRTEKIDALERHAEQINRCHGLDARHILLIQAVRELVDICRVAHAANTSLLAACEMAAETWCRPEAGDCDEKRLVYEQLTAAIAKVNAT